MSAGVIFVLWKAFLGFGLPVALGIWELRKLRPYREQDRAEIEAMAERRSTSTEGRPAPGPAALASTADTLRKAA